MILPESMLARELGCKWQQPQVSPSNPLCRRIRPVDLPYCTWKAITPPRGGYWVTPGLSPGCCFCSSSSASTAEAGLDGAEQTSTSNSSSSGDGRLTLEEVKAAAAARGLHIDLKDLGPVYRITCREGGPKGPILGVTSGFVAPWFGLMHCDTLQIFTKGMKGQEGQRIRGGVLGLGLLLGGATFAYGSACGCSKAEILAINDDDSWHERLVRYYSFFGFQPVCTVGGNGLADVPHLLVWGGEGTRMDADIQRMLAKWAPAIRKQARASNADK